MVWTNLAENGSKMLLYINKERGITKQFKVRQGACHTLNRSRGFKPALS